MTVPSIVKAGGGMIALAGAAIAAIVLFGPSAQGDRARPLGEPRADAPRQEAPRIDTARAEAPKPELTRGLAPRPEAAAGGARLEPAGGLPAPAAALRAGDTAPAPVAAAEARRKLDEAMRSGPQAGAQIASLAPAGDVTGAAPLSRSLAPPSASLASTPAGAALGEVAADVDDLCDRARRELQDGAVSGARALLTRAARSGAPKAVFLLAESWNPAALAEQGLVGAKGDPAKARALYEKALASGHAEAGKRLAALAR